MRTLPVGNFTPPLSCNDIIVPFYRVCQENKYGFFKLNLFIAERLIFLVSVISLRGVFFILFQRKCLFGRVSLSAEASDFKEPGH